jgi:K+-transporting ATPase KdpF subunit
MGVSSSLPELDGGTTVTIFYLISGILALGLLIYLFAALLKPEWFS